MISRALFNRRYLEATLGRELIRAERDGYEISVIMGDLDHFKDVNDRYGHLAGDQVLRVFGDLLKRHARGSDIYCRYGGEEFLLVMPKMPEDGAVNRAEDLRSRVASAPVTFGDSAIAVTASFGVAVFPRDGRTSDQLIAASDHALYAAKELAEIASAWRPRRATCREPHRILREPSQPSATRTTTP